MNWKKFKELTLKQKIVWLLQYYGIAAVVAVIAVVVLVIFIKSVFFSEPLSDVCVLILSDDISQDEAYSLQDMIEAQTGKTVQISAFSESDAYGKQAFSMKLTADELDIVVAPLEETKGMKESGYITCSRPIVEGKSYICKTIRTRDGDYIDTAMDIVNEYLLEKSR